MTNKLLLLLLLLKDDKSTIVISESSGYLLSSTTLVKYTKKAGDTYGCEIIKEKPGYYRDSSNYKNVIKCTASTCKDIKSTADTAAYTSGCSDNSKGKILTTNYNAVVCIDDSTGTVQRFSGTADYALGGTGSAFGAEADHYNKVEVSEDSIVLDVTATGKLFICF